MRKFFALLVIFAVLIGSAWSQASGGKAIVLKGGLVAAPNTTQVRTLERWSQLVKERTNGAVQIEIYPAEQLGNERTLLENANLGTIDWCLIGPSGAARFLPEFGIFENAYTFQGTKHIANTAFNRDFIEFLGARLAAKSNLKLLGFQWFGHRYMIADKPILTPEDGKGLRMRTPDVPAYKVAAYAVGATATPLAYGEVYMALSQGVINAAECPAENIFVMKWYEVKKVLTLTEHVEGMTSVFMNEKVFTSKLNKEQQKIVFDSALEAWAQFFANYQDVDATFRGKLADMGMKIYTPTPAQMDAFRKRAYEKLEAEYIPQWGDTWKKFIELAK